MKRQLFSVVTVFLMVLPGCASTGSSRYADKGLFTIDQEYVDTVDRTSRQLGVRVTWVNPPTKRVPVEGETSN
ncbi:MAG TPA: hypothetical protein VFN25_08750 [Dokdonella sp.]|uniref:hypothetical protein n=1 Tax=Dokdonella sp. TaxID=2291710 RepID=UPI002D7E6DCB|nr:hypothetical protein [Dokdonella sp.]HET9032980.1 hypothetical protein [Dokdonella sp.]